MWCNWPSSSGSGVNVPPGHESQLVLSRVAASVCRWRGLPRAVHRVSSSSVTHGKILEPRQRRNYRLVLKSLSFKYLNLYTNNFEIISAIFPPQNEVSGVFVIFKKHIWKYPHRFMTSICLNSVVSPGEMLVEMKTIGYIIEFKTWRNPREFEGRVNIE